MPKDRINLSGLGDVDLTPTEASHIYVHTPERPDVFLNVNGVPYYVGAHMYLWHDGKFHSGKEGENGLYEPYISRKDGNGRSGDYTASAKKKIREALELHVNAWVKAHPDAMVEAEVEDTEKELAKSASEISELNRELATKANYQKALSKKLDGLRVELRGYRRALAS